MTTALTQAPQLPDAALPQRRCTVGYAPNGRDTTTPSIRLSGKWLREAGFETGRSVTVKVTPEAILLVPEPVSSV